VFDKISVHHDTRLNLTSIGQLFLGLLISFIIFSGGKAVAESQYSYNLSGGLRTFPLGFSVGAETKWGQYLWDKREADLKSILFGLVQESFFVGSHGLIGINLDFYPISFIKISAGKSFVSKYYEIRTLDCTKVECKGTLARTYFKVALALGYDNYVLVPQYSNVNMVSRTHLIPFGSEDDYLVGAAGQDTAVSGQVLVGYKYFDSLVGLLVKSTQMKDYKDKAMSQYFLWQMPLGKVMDLSAIGNWQVFQEKSKMKLTLGAGMFSSDWADPGFSMIAGISFGGGNDPALF
jgi:hypothetical protein